MTLTSLPSTFLPLLSSRARTYFRAAVVVARFQSTNTQTHRHHVRLIVNFSHTAVAAGDSSKIFERSATQQLCIPVDGTDVDSEITHLRRSLVASGPLL